MRSFTNWASAGLALLTLAGLSSAQTQAPGKSVKKVSTSTPGRVVAKMQFDGERFVATADDYTILERPSNGTPSVGDVNVALPGQLKAKVLCIDASTSNGFFSAGTTGAEWLDWAQKDCLSTGVVSQLAIAYATSARDVSESNGTGGFVGVSLYEGTTGFCAKGTVATLADGSDARLGFFTLPGATGTQVSPGFLITAFLPDNNPICVADGKLGWGYSYLDDDGTGAAQTGPFLTEFGASTCWADAFDLWSRPDEFGTCAGTFFFGGCTLPLTFGVPNPCGGFYLQLWEDDCGGAGTQTPIVVAPNANALAPGAGPNIGEVFSQTQTALTAASLLQLNLDDISSLFAPGFAAGFLGGGTRLHLLFGPNYLTLGPVFAPVNNWAFIFPKNVGLCGAGLVTQGFDIRLPFAAGSIHAINAVSMQVGG